MKPRAEKTVIHLKVNGKMLEVQAPLGERLMWVLRDAGFQGVKHGCEDGTCGACTILLDGKAVACCTMLAAQSEGHEITTIEALGDPDHLHPLQERFIVDGAIQCGYCTPGMILSAQAMLAKSPDPSEEEIKDALCGNLCRCTGYQKPIQAIKKYAREKRDGR